LLFQTTNDLLSRKGLPNRTYPCPHPEQGFRSCIGILGLRKRYGAERLDAACAKALTLGTRSYGSVAAILKNKQESKTAPQRETDQPSLLHDNIRGPGYYH
jgi:hypothetical protein